MSATGELPVTGRSAAGEGGARLLQGIGRPRARVRARVVRAARLAGPPLALLALVIAAWYAVTYLVLDEDRRFLLPPPHEVLLQGFLNPDALGLILNSLLSSAGVALAGLAVASTIGISLAVVMSQAPWLERSIYPWAVVLQTIPILAIVPLIGFWFGFAFESRLIVCVLIALFPIVTNTLFGLKSVDRGHRDLFALHHATRWQRLTKLQLPGALPAMFTGLRISAGLSVIGAIVADFFFRQGSPGIGRLIDEYTQRLMAPELFAAIIVSSLFGLLVFWVFGALGRLATRSWVESIHEGE